MPRAMHEQLARIYHLALRLLLTPLWRPAAAAFSAALVLRLLGRTRTTLAACLAVLAGWLALVLPGSPLLPAGPVARLPGAAILLGLLLASPIGSQVPRWLALLLYATAASWWLRGAPFGGAAIASLVPVVLGLWTAAAIARRLAASDGGAATIAAAVALAVSIQIAGGASHWFRAALVPAFAGLALLGCQGAAAPLAQAVVLVAIAAIAASNRGRFVPVDLAAAAPFLVWLLAPRLLPRLNRAGPALAAAVAATCGIAAIWAATLLLAHR